MISINMQKIVVQLMTTKEAYRRKVTIKHDDISDDEDDSAWVTGGLTACGVKTVSIVD